MRRSTPFSWLNSAARSDDALLEVLATEVGVAVGGLAPEDASADLEHRDVEGAAAQVVDGDAPGLHLVEAIGERRGGGLVDDPAHLEAGDAPGVLVACRWASSK